MSRADVSYVPGALTAVVGERFWVLIEASPDSPVVARLWRQRSQGASAGAVVAGLLTDGVAGVPAFALLTVENGGQHRLFCRGVISATVVAGVAARPHSRERVDGAGLLTWREQVFANAERVFLGEPPADTALRLPAMSGVLLASCVTVDFTPDAAPDTAASEPVKPARPGTATSPFPDTITITRPGSAIAHPADPAGGGQERPDGLIDAPSWLASPVEPGATIKRTDLSQFIDRTAPPDRIGPMVPALICPAGHVCPPTGASCRRCGAPLPPDPVPVPRPVLGVLRLSLGDVITLDRGVLMGRNPRADFDNADGAQRPHVVKLPSADGDISRTHLQVTLDGWHVLVTDLGSTNGTLVTLPGRDPEQLRPGEPVLIQPGTLVVLAEGIDFRYEAAE
jgi:hypothetical protein